MRGLTCKSIAEAVGVPVDLISTGPERSETIVVRHPFEEGTGSAS